MCAGCGQVTSRLTWLVVDAVERPDLVARISDLVEVECPDCQLPLQRSQPLLVLRLARAAPLIAARATSDDRDPLETLGEVVSATQRALGEKLLEVLGPAVIATFDEIEAGAEKDIDADIGALLGGASGSGGSVRSQGASTLRRHKATSLVVYAAASSLISECQRVRKSRRCSVNATWAPLRRRTQKYCRSSSNALQKRDADSKLPKPCIG